MMKKIHVLSLFYLSLYGFGQIPNFPESAITDAKSLPDFSGQNFSHSVKTSIPSRPTNFHTGSASEINRQNMKMVQEDFKRVAQKQEIKSKQKEQDRQQAIEESVYNLPSFSETAGTQSYYNAYNQLASLNTDIYSISEANFIVENAYYGNKQNYNQFKSGIQKTAKQLLQKMKDRKQDPGSNTDKNLMIF